MTGAVPLSRIDLDDVPIHIAAIMDGNGRWATGQGLPRTKGHEAGEDATFEAVEGCLAAGVKWFTVYAFSTENWRRPKAEVQFLINFNRELLRRRRDELHERDIRIRFIGRRNWRVPRGLLKDMEAAEQLTAKNKAMTFNIAFNYGGRAEITDAVTSIVESGVAASKVSESLIAKHLYDPSMPDPELMIRTSGEHRVSNFLMWQLAYTEMIFSDVMWPDVTRKHIWGAIEEYQARNRRFGAV